MYICHRQYLYPLNFCFGLKTRRVQETAGNTHAQDPGQVGGASSLQLRLIQITCSLQVCARSPLTHHTFSCGRDFAGSGSQVFTTTLYEQMKAKALQLQNQQIACCLHYLRYICIHAVLLYLAIRLYFSKGSSGISVQVFGYIVSSDRIQGWGQGRKPAKLLWIENFEPHQAARSGQLWDVQATGRDWQSSRKRKINSSSRQIMGDIVRSGVRSRHMQ